MKEITDSEKRLHLHRITLSASLALLPGGPVRAAFVGPVLLQEETGDPGKNLRSSVEFNWTSLFLVCDQRNCNQITARSRN